jgi:hypothetical protein
MGYRDNLISKSILHAIFRDRKTSKRTTLGRILAFFTFFQLHLVRYKDEIFKRLRDEIWEMDEDEYRESFRSQDKKGKLKAVGDLGYSGSVRTEFTITRNCTANTIIDVFHNSKHKISDQISSSPFGIHILRQRPSRTL